MTGIGATTSPRLEIRRAAKTFGSRTVLRDVELDVAPGEVHGVVGQNGSGKSTLAKIISGYHAPDAGCEMRVDGRPLPLPVRLADLHAAGVAIVYQDLGLMPDRSVAANVRIGTVTGSRFARKINWRAESAAAARSLDRLGFGAAMSTRVQDLTPADKARVAISRALQQCTPGRGLVLFDESTRALPEDALAEFYGVLRTITSEGTSVVIIGHRLREILEHCDRVTVLRDGECVGRGLSTDGLGEAELATVMLGAELSELSFTRTERPHRERIAVGGVSGGGLSEPLDLTLGSGEIVGLTGLPGSGYEAVPYLLSGARPAAGRLAVDGDVIELAGGSVRAMSRRGVVLVPEGRATEGLCMTKTVRDNICLPWQGRRGRPLSLGRTWQAAMAQQVIDSLHVVPPDADIPAGRLSGGNQQKVLLGKWLSGEPRLLILHEPTQAVDIQARHDILEAIHRVAYEGTPVLLASSEAADLGVLCDRILVFCAGKVAGELVGPCEPSTVLDHIYRREAQHA